MNTFTIIKGHWDKEKTQVLKDLYHLRRTQGMKEDVAKKYTFQVDIRANKHQIRRAVELSLGAGGPGEEFGQRRVGLQHGPVTGKDQRGYGGGKKGGCPGFDDIVLATA